MCQNRHATPFKDLEKTKLVAAALGTWMAYNLPPLTTEALLMTLFHGKHGDIMTMVRVDDTASTMDCCYATVVLCLRYGIRFSVLESCLRWVGTWSIPSSV